MDKKIACGYIRVSTNSQTELSPQSQIKTIREFASHKGYIIPDKYIYQDTGISGRNALNRPEFNKMIAVAKENPSPFSAIIVWKFSRFARNQEEAIFYKGILKKRGIEVISASEPITEGPFGSLIERIIEWFDEYYSINLSTEVKRGMKEKVLRGGAVSIPPFGYNIKDKKYIINTENAEIVRKIYSDFISGKSETEIASELNRLGITSTKGNKWEKRTINYILNNPVYTGKIRWNASNKTGRNYNDKGIIITEGKHTPIISDEIFTMAKSKLSNTKTIPYISDRKNSNDYMLKGLVKCSCCNGNLSMSSNNSLQCINYAHKKCSTSHYISLLSLNTAVINTLLKIFPQHIIKFEGRSFSNYDFNKDILIKKERNKLKRIKDAYEKGAYTLNEYIERNNIIKEKINSIKYFEEEKNKNTHINHFTFSLLSTDKISEKYKNNILKSFIEKIIYNKEKNEIEIYFR